MDLIDRSKLHSVSVVDSINSEGVITTRSFWASDVANAPTIEAIPIEWLENFTNNYCDLAAAIDTQFFINEFILKRWRAESEGKDWPQAKNNAEKNYQYIKKLLREGKTLEAAKFVEEKENETD